MSEALVWVKIAELLDSVRAIQTGPPIMIRSLCTIAITCLFLAGTNQSTQADIFVGLTVSPLSAATDLSALSPGDVVTFDVLLSGDPFVPPAPPTALTDEISFIGVPIMYDPVIFGAPAADASPGPIVLSPLLGVDFFPDAFPDVGAVYAPFLPADNIVDAGLFYSFELSVIGTGIGTIEISPLSFADDETLTPVPLSFSAPLLATSVPEPSSILLLTLGYVGFIGLRRARRNQITS